MDGERFILDEDSVEVEGLPTDEIDERAMKRGSFALLGALNAARGLPPPIPPRDPALAPLPAEFIERYLRRPDEVPATAQVMVPRASVSRTLLSKVAFAFDITVPELVGKSRVRDLVCARIVASRLLRDLTWEDGLPRFSLPQIGRMIGGRDHSTIHYHLQVFDAYCRKYPEMAVAYVALRGADEQ